MTLGPFHISAMNLILWGCVIWLPAFMAVILRNETKFKKNLSMGVTLPQEAREDSEVLTILDSFKKTPSCFLASFKSPFFNVSVN